MPDSLKSKLENEREIPIISARWHYNKRRFSDILNAVEGISNRMLSRESKELEINQLEKRWIADEVHNA
jgi:DNA-binding HxlR family transcriptional regulator